MSLRQHGSHTARKRKTKTNGARGSQFVTPPLRAMVFAPGRRQGLCAQVFLPPAHAQQGAVSERFSSRHGLLRGLYGFRTRRISCSMPSTTV